MSNSDIPFTEALGVDVGSKRIGVARVNAIARLPSPVATVAMNDASVAEIARIADEVGADLIVVGLPQGVRGQDTEQSVFSRQFADRLESLGIPIEFHDETLSTKQAEQLLSSGAYKLNEAGQPVGLDEVAACIILNDFIGEKIGL